MRYAKPTALVAVALVLLTGAGGALATAAASTSTAAGPVECAQSCNSGPVALEDVAAQQDAANESAGGEETETVITEVGRYVRVTDAHYDDANNTYYVTLHNTGEATADATLTEMIDASDSGGTFGIKSVSVASSEEVEVAVSAKRYGDTAGVMITTDRSKSRGTGGYVTDVETGPGVSLVDGAASWIDVQLTAIGAVVIGTLGIVLGAWQFVSEDVYGGEEVDL